MLRDRLAAAAPVSGLALAEALWARMCAGTREDGSGIEPNDPIWPQLQQAALKAKVSPAAWLEETGLYTGFAADGPFTGAFDRWMEVLWSQGCEAALAQYTGSSA